MIEQRDRDAAADFGGWDDFRSGAFDEHKLVQAFARHRIEALAPRTPAEDIAGLVERPDARTALWNKLEYLCHLDEIWPLFEAYEAATALSSHASDIAGRDAAVVAQIVAWLRKQSSTGSFFADVIESEFLTTPDREGWSCD